MNRRLIAFLLCALAVSANGSEKADLVLVKKSESRLYLKHNEKTLASFHVAFGAHPNGPKQRQGDERTPEGRYVLDSKNARSGFYKSIHVSYPNERDRANAKKHGYDAGGDIMIHGQRIIGAGYGSLDSGSTGQMGALL